MLHSIPKHNLRIILLVAHLNIKATLSFVFSNSFSTFSSFLYCLHSSFNGQFLKNELDVNTFPGSHACWCTNVVRCMSLQKIISVTRQIFRAICFCVLEHKLAVISTETRRNGNSYMYCMHHTYSKILIHKIKPLLPNIAPVYTC